MTIGERIKQRRIEVGLSASELGAAIGKNKATIYRYENGEIYNVQISAIEPLAAALRVTPAWLMGWIDKCETIPEKSNAPPPEPLDEMDVFVLEKYKRLSIPNRYEALKYMDELWEEQESQKSTDRTG